MSDSGQQSGVSSGNNGSALNIGGVGGQTGPVSDVLRSSRGGVPADLVGGPLTSALRQLSQAIDPSPVSNKSIVYRPEYYVQHVAKGTQVTMLDHSKLTYKEWDGSCDAVPAR